MLPAERFAEGFLRDFLDGVRAIGTTSTFRLPVLFARSACRKLGERARGFDGSVALWPAQETYTKIGPGRPWRS